MITIEEFDMKCSSTSRVWAGASVTALAVTVLNFSGAAALELEVQDIFAYDQGWRLDRHPRELADVNGDGNLDIVGFGPAGTWVALGGRLGLSYFTTPVLTVADYGYDQGWRVDRHPRELADVNGDDRADIVGFGYAGTYVSYGKTDGTFTAPARKLRAFGEAQGWAVDRHPRELADVNGDDRADIVGFGDTGTWVALGRADGTFSTPVLEAADFGYGQGWRVDKHPRQMGDVNGDDRADIVGFGNAGTYVSYGKADGTFTDAVLVMAQFGYDQGWRVERHPREVVDVRGDTGEDIVGFGDTGTWVASGRADGTLSTPVLEVAAFGYGQGWRVEQHPRKFGDFTKDTRPEIFGFGDPGYYTSFNNIYVPEEDPVGVFDEPGPAVPHFGAAQGWRADRHLRDVVDLNSDGFVEIIGFGQSATYIGWSP